MKRIRETRQAFYSTFSPEISSLRRFMNLYPLLTVGLTFLIGAIVGGLLSAWPSQFIILALVGGYGFANALGSTIGLPSYVSVALVVPILAFTTYAGLRILHSIDQYARVSPHLARVRKQYSPISSYLVTHAGAFGIIGVIAVAAFLIGWWVTIVIAYILDVKVSTAMIGTGIGLLIGAFVFWTSYEGLTRWIPNPLIITAITIVIFSALARIITYKAQHRKLTRYGAEEATKEGVA